MKKNNIINFSPILDNRSNQSTSVYGSLAYNTQPLTTPATKSAKKIVDFFNEEKEQYEKPVVKKLVIKKQTKKIFMGCWQGCNEDSEGDGC